MARAAIVLVIVVALAACNGSSESADSPDEYPLVEQERPAVAETVTTESGAVVSLLELPTIYEAEPSPTCERAASGAQTVVVPPAPGLEATALNDRTIRLDWSFDALPDDCRPVRVLLAITNDSSPRASPTVEEVEVADESGSFELTYPDFLEPPNVARAAAVSEAAQSRTVRVLIRRD